MISRLCGCLQITLKKYKINGITGTSELLDAAHEMVPDQRECTECGRNVDEFGDCYHRDETYTGDIERDDSVFLPNAKISREAEHPNQ